MVMFHEGIISKFDQCLIPFLELWKWCSDVFLGKAGKGNDVQVTLLVGVVPWAGGMML